jgi:hypothetical protein
MLEYVGHIGDKKTILSFFDENLPLDKVNEVNEKLSEYKYTAEVVGTTRENKERIIILRLNSPIGECSNCITEFKDYYMSILKDIEMK